MSRATEKQLRELLAEALEPGVFGYQDRSGIRDEGLDPIVTTLCERHGYGAVMDSASRMWAEKCAKDFPGSNHTVAACASVRQDWCKRAAAALK